MSRSIPTRLQLRQPYICRECMRRQFSSSPPRKVRAREQPTATSSVLNILEERGLVNQIAGDRRAMHALFRQNSVGLYAGVDPTAPSLHLGHLLPMMVLFWAAISGHRTVSLIGGATARVGDPSGRLTSRVETAEDLHEAHAIAMTEQTNHLWQNALLYARRRGHRQGPRKQRVLNNEQWLKKLNILEFLKTVGSGMRLGTMLGRDTVKNKIEKGDGMSFSEFTYPLLQGWDWWYMFRNYGIQVQVGGSDQYGNIIAGMDAVKYIAQNSEEAAEVPGFLDSDGKVKEEHAPMGLTVPLLTTSSGEKFGKSAGNAVWLDRTFTTPFDLYGFLLRSSDVDVERYLKLFTFVSMEDISSIMKQHNSERGKRKAQHLLASEVLELVHGRYEAERTRKEHEQMRNPDLAALIRKISPKSEGTESVNQELKAQESEDQTSNERIMLPKSLVLEYSLSRILYSAKLVSSKSEGARLQSSGGAYVAVKKGDGDALEFRPMNSFKRLDISDLILDGSLIVRLGKWKVRTIEIVEDDDFDKQGLDAPGWAELKATNESVRSHVRQLRKRHMESQTGG